MEFSFHFVFLIRSCIFQYYINKFSPIQAQNTIIIIKNQIKSDQI